MHEGQRIKNSVSSDTMIAIWPRGEGVPDTRLELAPGNWYDIEKADVGLLKVYVEGNRFRVKRNNGEWQAWQDLPAGTKTFSPADSEISVFQTDL